MMKPSNNRPDNRLEITSSDASANQKGEKHNQQHLSTLNHKRLKHSADIYGKNDPSNLDTSAIVVHNIGKQFNHYRADKPVTFMETILSGFGRLQPVETFWALQDISFSVAPGEMLGIIGHNGAGKSTLLQILGKVAYPSKGHITLRGHVGALLDLGAGFHGDLTGRENVFITAIVSGLPRAEVARRLESIIEFAELESFIDNPVRTYSSGMMMRLAFSVAVHTDPEILLVDEFLSVGDLSFQAKCLNRISKMKEDGCAIVLVSHDVSQIERLCDRALWLKHGRIMAYGEPVVVAGQYTSDMRIQTEQRTPLMPPSLTAGGTELKVHENRFGSLEAEITNVRLCPDKAIQTGSELCVELDYKTHQPIKDAIFSMTISNEEGTDYISTDSLEISNCSVRLEAEGTIKFLLERLDLCAGNYFVDLGMYKADWSYAYDYHWHVYPLTINSLVPARGMLKPPIRLEVSTMMSTI